MSHATTESARVISVAAGVEKTGRAPAVADADPEHVISLLRPCVLALATPPGQAT
jgi:hypothetical protein